MEVEIVHFVQDWFEDQDFAHLWPRHDILLDLEKDRWLNRTHAPDASERNTLDTCAKHVEDCKVVTEDWLVQNFELGELSDSLDRSVSAASSNESDADEFDYGAFTDRAHQRDQLHQTGS